jgi:hypothetical protein
MTSGRLALVHAVVLTVALGVVAWLSPLPHRVTDRDVYEATAARHIVPDCTDLHCFRVLVPWILGTLPGPSSIKWKAYAVTGNVAAALAVFQLAFALGMSRRVAWLASTMSAFGFGSLYTLHDPYTADPLMYALGPIILNELLRERLVTAGMIGTVGVLAKEFAAAPLFIAAADSAVERRWPHAANRLAMANLALIVWLLLQLTLMLRFNYSYGDNPSTHLLSGGYLAPWLAMQSTRGALSAMFNEYGALYLLAPLGLLFAPARLRRLALLATPVALLFAYVQQPDRALWNVHFIATPLAAAVLEYAPSALAWSAVATFALANLRVGAQLSIVPSAAPILVCSVALALCSAWFAVSRPKGGAPGLGPVGAAVGPLYGSK